VSECSSRQLKQLQHRLRTLVRQDRELNRLVAINRMGSAAQLDIKPYEMAVDVQNVLNRRHAFDILKSFGYRVNKKKDKLCLTYMLEDNIYADINLTKPIDADKIEVDLFNYIYVRHVLEPKRLKAMRTRETKAKRLHRLLLLSEQQAANVSGESSEHTTHEPTNDDDVLCRHDALSDSSE